jgi:quercetin dioxygenase-like cupin family protein
MLKVEPWNPASGELNEANLRHCLEQENYQVIVGNYAPGSNTGRHTHSIIRKDAVLSGRLKVSDPESEVILGPGDAVVIPIDLLHSAAVEGDEPVVLLEGWHKPR